MTSPFSAQRIPAPSTFLSGEIVELYIPPAIQSISLTLLLDPAVESSVQDGNQCQSTSVPAPLPSPDLDLLERPANRSTIEPATNPDPSTLHLDSLHDENIASLLEALAEDFCNTDEDVTPAGEKRTLAKDAYDADEDVATAGKKKTWRKVALLLDRDVAPAGKKRIRGKEKVRPRKKMRLREKRRCIKKTLSVVGLETHKMKSDSEEMLGSEVSNANSVVRPASRLSNTGSEVESGSGNGEVEKSDNESIIMICSALISPFCISLCLSTSLEMVNAVILKLPNVHPPVNFETISWTAKKRVVFKIDPNKNNCDCSPTLIGL